MTSDDTVGCGQTSWEPYFALSHETMRNCPASSASARRGGTAFLGELDATRDFVLPFPPLPTALSCGFPEEA